MKKGKQAYRSYVIAVLILIMLALPAGLLMVQAWRGYEEKMEILYAVLQDEEMESVDIVTGLLKGQITAEPAEVEQRLALYGFHRDFADRYKKSLYLDWTVIVVIFWLMGAGLLALLFLTDRRQKQMRKAELLGLQECVTGLRDSVGGSLSADLSDSIGSETDAHAMDSGQNMLENGDEDLGRLLMEFAALADSIGLFGRRAGAEREGTKALVTDISHQLKTPVAALKTCFEILQSGGLDPAEQQEFLGRCGIQILRLEELVSALVNISRMETGMIRLKKEERDLFDTILLAVNRIYPKAEERGIEIELEAGEELHQVKVLHDPKWLCEAFLNVLENAVKYSAGQTKITIRMIRLTVYVRVEIEDEGIGIPRSDWNRIFQRFYRGGADEVQRESGSGVGLYLAREIASRHDGTLVVATPRHGKRGSCFVFQLPYRMR